MPSPFRPLLLALTLLLAGGAWAFDIPYLWLEGPSGRTNRFDPKSPLYKSPTPVWSATSTRTTTGTPSITPTYSNSSTASPTFTDTDTATPTSTETPTYTDTYTVTPTWTNSPSSTPTSTITETSTDSPTPTATPSPTDTASPTATPTPTPFIFEDFTTGSVVNPATSGTTSIVYAIDNTVSTSPPNSLHLTVNSTGGGAAFDLGSNYYNGLGVVDATNMASFFFEIQTDRNIYFTIRLIEGTAVEGGGDQEAWESRWIYILTQPGFQTVGVNLYQFIEDLTNPLCSPGCAGGNNTLDLASIKKVQIKFAAAPLAQVYLDDLRFTADPAPHNGDWPMVTTFGWDYFTLYHTSYSGWGTDRTYWPCGPSTSSITLTRPTSGGWDSGPYFQMDYYGDVTAPCGGTLAEFWMYLQQPRDLTGYTGIRFRHRAEQAGDSYTLILATNTFACAPQPWATYTFTSSLAWTTESIPFSAFTDSSVTCPYIGSGVLTNIEFVVFDSYITGNHRLDIDDIEFY